MDIRQLRYFSAIAEAGSFTKAAERVRIAQPALGLQIKKLEEELGTDLLVRHSRGVQVTEAGALLLRHASSILQQVEDARLEVMDLSGTPRGKVVVGVTPTVSALLITPLVEISRETYPDIILNIVEGLSEEVMRKLDDKTLDIGFTYNPNAVFGIATEPLLIEDLYLVRCRGDYPGFVDFGDVCNERLVLPSKGFGLREQIETGARERGLSIDVAFEVNSVAAMRELVEDGVCSTVLPYGALKKSVAAGRLSISRIARPRMSRTLYLATAFGHAETNASRAVRRVIERVAVDIVASSGGMLRMPNPSQAV